MLVAQTCSHDDVGLALDARIVRAHSWRELRWDPNERRLPDARRPASRPDAIDYVARVATIPHVVDHAAGLQPPQRLRHVAFVAGLACCGFDVDNQVGVQFVENAYRATSMTAKRIATDLSRSRIWEEWEGCLLLRGCATLAGRLRITLMLAGA